MEPSEELKQNILTDYEKITDAELCVIDNNCGIFVLPSGERVEICGTDMIIAVAVSNGIRVMYE